MKKSFKECLKKADDEAGWAIVGVMTWVAITMVIYVVSPSIAGAFFLIGLLPLCGPMFALGTLTGAMLLYLLD